MHDEVDKPKATLGSMLDLVDVGLYGGLGALLLGGLVYHAGAAVLASRSVVALGAFCLVVVATVASIVADVRRRRFGVVSRLLVGAWLACVVAVSIMELASLAP